MQQLCCAQLLRLSIVLCIIASQSTLIRAFYPCHCIFSPAAPPSHLPAYRRTPWQQQDCLILLQQLKHASPLCITQPIFALIADQHDFFVDYCPSDSADPKFLAQTLQLLLPVAVASLQQLHWADAAAVLQAGESVPDAVLQAAVQIDAAGMLLNSLASVSSTYVMLTEQRLGAGPVVSQLVRTQIQESGMV
jgi:hypothetical protein